MKRKHLFGVLLLSVVFATPLGCGKNKPKESEPSQQPNSNTNTQSGSNPQGNRQPLGEPKYRITAKQLLTEYVADKENALAKYYGNVVELTGTTSDHVMLNLEGLERASHSEKTAKYGAKLTLREERPNNTLGTDSICIIAHSPDKSVVGKVFRGQSVKLKGRAEKMRLLDGWIQLKDCEVIESGKENPLRLKSDEVAAEATRSLYELAKKCDNQTLVISGEVMERGTKGYTDAFIELKGDGKTRVLCLLNEEAMKLFSRNFPAGEKVVFAGTVSLANEPQRAGQVIVRDCIPLHRQPNASDGSRR